MSAKESNTRIVVSEYGGPEVLTVVEEAVPIPKPGELRVRNMAVGVALGDVMRREGVYPGSPVPPFTPGYDFIGMIDAVGQDIDSAWLGQHAAGMTEGLGAYSRYICVPASQVVRVPQHLDPQAVVAIILNYVTAHQMLHRYAKAAKGQTILIHGASGGVGTALLELGQRIGLNLIGTASASKHSILQQRFGGKYIDYNQEDVLASVKSLANGKVDAVFDPLGSDNWDLSKQALKDNGIIVSYGFTKLVTGTPEDKQNQKLLTDWIQLLKDDREKEPEAQTIWAYSVTTLKRTQLDWFLADLTHLILLLEQGKLKPIIDQVFNIRDVYAAHARVQSRLGVGKIILSF